MKIDIPLSELKKRKLFLAVPMYGGVCAGMFTKSIADLTGLCKEMEIPLQLHFLFNESLITRARNYCADEFMRSDATHMMFIDSDIGFNPHDVIALLSLTGDDTPYDVIGGPYPKKCISWEKIKLAVDKGIADKDPNRLENFVGDFVFNPKFKADRVPLGEPLEVLEIGTGFMMIRKNTLKKFSEAFPEYMYRPDHVRSAHFDGKRLIMMYFQAEQDRYNAEKAYGEVLKAIAESDGNAFAEHVQKAAAVLKDAEEKLKASSNRYLSEDYWFCQKIQQIGMKTWLCPWMRMQHVGTYIFGGSLMDLASVGAAATADPSKLNK
jgi:hypothetical protein